MQNKNEIISELLLSLKKLLEPDDKGTIGDGVMPPDDIVIDAPPEEVIPDMIVDQRPEDYETYPRSRAEAKGKGRKYYMMTKPCKNGHFGLRQVHNAQCVTCRLLLNAHFFGDGLRPRIRRWSKQSLEATNRRAKAMAKGQKYYDSGMNCVHGHESALRYTSSNGCVECLKELRKTKQGNFEVNQQKLIDLSTNKP